MLKRDAAHDRVVAGRPNDRPDDGCDRAHRLALMIDTSIERERDATMMTNGKDRRRSSRGRQETHR
jgi:hypothetical protein